MISLLFNVNQNNTKIFMKKLLPLIKFIKHNIYFNLAQEDLFNLKLILIHKIQLVMNQDIFTIVFKLIVLFYHRL